MELGEDGTQIYIENEFISNSVKAQIAEFEIAETRDFHSGILWLDHSYNLKQVVEWEFDESSTYVNWFKKDEALTIKKNLA